MLKSTINFEDIKSIVSAAEHMQLAGKNCESKNIMLNLANELRKALTP